MFEFGGSILVGMGIYVEQGALQEREEKYKAQSRPFTGRSDRSKKKQCYLVIALLGEQ